jgi:hypothetical protein
MKLCGWESISDPQFVHKRVLAENLRRGESVYWANIRGACAEFNIKAPSLHQCALNRLNDSAIIGLMLKPVNKILSVMYGVTIGSRASDPGMYFLSHNTLFTTDPQISMQSKRPLLMAARAGPKTPMQIRVKPRGAGADGTNGTDGADDGADGVMTGFTDLLI